MERRVPVQWHTGSPGQHARISTFHLNQRSYFSLHLHFPLTDLRTAHASKSLALIAAESGLPRAGTLQVDWLSLALQRVRRIP